MVEHTNQYRSYGPDTETHDGYDDETRDYPVGSYKFGRSAKDHSVPLFLSDPESEPDPEEFAVPLRSSRRLSISSKILASVLVAAAAAILVALFSSDDMRNIAINAKASFSAVLPGPSVAAQPDSVQLTAKDIQLKDPARPTAPANMAAVVPPPNVPTPGVRSKMAMAPSREDITTAYQSALQGRAPAAAAPAAVAAPAAPVRRLDPDELATLMTRAKGLLAAGDIPPARLLLERAADAQEPTAALMLAQTYDPAVLERRMPATSFPISRWRAPGTSGPSSSARPRRNGGSVKCNSFQLRTSKMRRLIGLALVASMMACGFAARAAEDGEFDPAKVSESLKAIFQFGSADTKKALNSNTVTLISGTIGGTYVQFGADLASVLDDGNKLRVLPIVGRGSVQSVADILFLQGVDLGIVRSDTLDYLEKKGFAKDIKKQFTYVTKLYNEELHVIASKSIRNLKELDGKTVSVDLPNGGTFVTSLTVFERLGIRPNVVYIEQRIALEKMRAGANSMP